MKQRNKKSICVRRENKDGIMVCHPIQKHIIQLNLLIQDEVRHRHACEVPGRR